MAKTHVLIQRWFPSGEGWAYSKGLPEKLRSEAIARISEAAGSYHGEAIRHTETLGAWTLHIVIEPDSECLDSKARDRYPHIDVGILTPANRETSEENLKQLFQETKEIHEKGEFPPIPLPSVLKKGSRFRWGGILAILMIIITAIVGWRMFSANPEPEQVDTVVTPPVLPEVEPPADEPPASEPPVSEPLVSEPSPPKPDSKTAMAAWRENLKEYPDRKEDSLDVRIANLKKRQDLCQTAIDSGDFRDTDQISIQRKINEEGKLNEQFARWKNLEDLFHQLEKKCADSTTPRTDRRKVCTDYLSSTDKTEFKSAPQYLEWKQKVQDWEKKFEREVKIEDWIRDANAAVASLDKKNLDDSKKKSISLDVKDIDPNLQKQLTDCKTNLDTAIQKYLQAEDEKHFQEVKLAYEKFKAEFTAEPRRDAVRKANEYLISYKRHEPEVQKYLEEIDSYILSEDLEGLPETKTICGWNPAFKPGAGEKSALEKFVQLVNEGVQWREKYGTESHPNLKFLSNFPVKPLDEFKFPMKKDEYNKWVQDFSKMGTSHPFSPLAVFQSMTEPSKFVVKDEELNAFIRKFAQGDEEKLKYVANALFEAIPEYYCTRYDIHREDVSARPYFVIWNVLRIFKPDITPAYSDSLNEKDIRAIIQEFGHLEFASDDYDEELKAYMEIKVRLEQKGRKVQK